MTFTKKEFYTCILGLFVCWISSFYMIRQFFPNISDSGAFGDTFGAINSLFSGFALFGIIVSIFMQREELKLQREELRMTRDELAKSAEAQGEQVEVQKQIAQLNANIALYENFQVGSNSAGYKIREKNSYRDEIKNILTHIQES